MTKLVLLRLGAIPVILLFKRWTMNKVRLWVRGKYEILRLGNCLGICESAYLGDRSGIGSSLFCAMGVRNG